MIDLSRHFFSKKTLLEMIDLMAMHKLNRLHLHLTDDPGWRIEIESYPKLAAIGGRGDISNPDSLEARYLTAEDIDALVAYARQRHIEIVPEIDMPGHAGAAARAYPEYFDGGHTFNPGNPGTFAFVERVLEEVCERFPSRYVHFGGDEVRNHRWHAMPQVAAFMDENDYKTYTEVEAHFDRFVTDFLLSRGKTPIGWDEIVVHGVDRRTVVQWWRGREPQMLRRAVAQGHSVIISPADHVYLDYPAATGEPGAPWEGNDNGPNTLELIYEWEPVPKGLTAEEEDLVVGVEACVWTEFIKTERYLQYMTLPRVAALADVAWRPKGVRDKPRFLQDMREQCRRYGAAGTHYRPLGEYSPEYMRH